MDSHSQSAIRASGPRVDMQPHGRGPRSTQPTQAQAPASAPEWRVVAMFDTSAQAERALDELRTIGVAPEEISVVMRDPQAEQSATTGTSLGAQAAGGAATGATFGGLFGGLSGWLLGIGALAIPGVGPFVSIGVLTSASAGVVIGAALGGLLGAVIGVGLPAGDERQLEDQVREGRILVNVQPAVADPGQIEGTLLAAGGTDVKSYRLESGSREQPPAAAETSEQEVASGGEGEPPADDADTMQAENAAANMEDQPVDDKDMARDPNSVTGTQGSIDPETGAYGTAGTPLTTGYGVSGSTVGTGSEAIEEQIREGDVVGSTPDRVAYDQGGRDSSDHLDEVLGSDAGPSVASKYAAPAGSPEATPVQTAPDRPDIYEQGPSYGPNTGLAAGENATDYYSDASVDAAPTYSNVKTERANESAGTNIPGTADPTGLGDNVEDQDNKPV